MATILLATLSSPAATAATAAHNATEPSHSPIHSHGHLRTCDPFSTHPTGTPSTPLHSIACQLTNAHTPSPSTNQPFPPPPPPPLPTAAPTTPNATSFKHSPTHQAPPAPPSTVPFPQPPLQDSWHPTDSHWDSNALHGHQLHRTIQPTQWSRRVGIVGLPTFDVFPWLLAYTMERPITRPGL